MMRQLSVAFRRITPLILMVVSGPLYAAPEVPHARIINGQDTTENLYPWMSVIFSAGGVPEVDLFACGATLIDKNYVLTAAHCVYSNGGFKVSASAAQVLVGRTVLSSATGQLRNISRIIEYPGYEHSRFVPVHDIALLRLQRPVAGPTLELLQRDAETSEALILGWGQTDIDSVGIFPDVLQAAKVQIQSSTLCRERYGLLFRRTEMVCAGILATAENADDGVDTCSGDSGGPLLVEENGVMRQVGVTSFGVGCGSERFPGVYTRVVNYYSWIQSIITSANTFESALSDIRNIATREPIKKAAMQNLQANIRVLRNLGRTLLSEVRQSFPKFDPRFVRRLSRSIGLLKKNRRNKKVLKVQRRKIIRLVSRMLN